MSTTIEDAAGQPSSPESNATSVSPRSVVPARSRADRIYRGVMLGIAVAAFVLLFLIGLFLLLKGLGITRHESIGTFLTTSAFQPTGAHPVVGVLALLYWTVVIALIALVIGVPIAVAAALFITEYAPLRLRRFLVSLIDLLAVVPSVIFGLWGVYELQPNVIGFSRFLAVHFSFIPLFKVTTAVYTSSAFIAGIVVGIMIVPIVASICREIFSLTPEGEREGALALGSTRAGVIRSVVLPFGRGGLIGAIMLGLGRAMGETIAVAIIVSLTLQIDPHLLGVGANSIAAFIALRFATGGQFGLSGLMAAGFVLFVFTMLVNFAASIVVNRSRTGASA
ncbi:MAG: phosphate ABC transporter permease subunit PstC [Acidimicrobiales bacterium]